MKHKSQKKSLIKWIKTSFNYHCQKTYQLLELTHCCHANVSAGTTAMVEPKDLGQEKRCLLYHLLLHQYNLKILVWLSCRRRWEIPAKRSVNLRSSPLTKTTAVLKEERKTLFSTPRLWGLLWRGLHPPSLFLGTLFSHIVLHAHGKKTGILTQTWGLS